MSTVIVPHSPTLATETPLYKFLTADLQSPTGNGGWTVEIWRSVDGELVPCRNGLHAAKALCLLPNASDTLWRVEVGDEYLWHGSGQDRKIVARRMRIVEQIVAWNDRTARMFAADCAERVLPIFESAHPTDTRPRRAIETARRFAAGDATPEELAAAEAAAWTAWSAAGTAWSAAGAAAWAAWAAAWAAAGAAAGAASRAAVGAASRAAGAAAERDWQAAHLCRMLGLEGGI